jgi:hypothetical protein
VSDIDTAAVDSLKALDPERPIREVDIRERSILLDGSGVVGPIGLSNLKTTG